MNTPVEHRPASSGTAAEPEPPPSRQAGSVPAEAGRSVVPVQPSHQAVPAERRGRTDIADRVVSRIAAHAAGEVPRVREVGERRPLSLRGGTRAAVDGGLATLRLDVAVEYPAPIREVAEEIRRHVAERVMTLTGMDVGHVDVLVTDVTPARDDHDGRGTPRAGGTVPSVGGWATGAGQGGTAQAGAGQAGTAQAGAGAPGRASTPGDDPADGPTEEIVPLREER
ncbi:Asp23/Gls24 family envelope stress response protein [Streptosporangium sp. NPDC048865]|uniref:Asp23/Gls24 family envelope stress response protein n=1 Tax=Streptosporangium sp. NPDC048865 TaxID=3155766 RepID=UPI0034441E71